MNSAANWENFFGSSLRAVQFASVSSCARRLLIKAFQLQILSYDAYNRCFRNSCLLWYFTDCGVSSGWSSWLKTISFTWSVFSSAQALRGLSLPWRLSTVPVSLNFLNNLFMLLVVHPLSGNSVLNCLALYPFNWYNFLLQSYVRGWKPCLQTMH